MNSAQPNFNETEMIAFAQEGDLDAFNRLVLHYQDIAFGVAYRLMSDALAADDVTQEAFISAYTKLHTFKGGSFKAWLLRIVTNQAYDVLRSHKRRPTVPLEPGDQGGEEIDEPAWLEDPDERPEDAALRHELAQAIQRCLDALAVDFRTVVVLVDVEGMDYAEVAQSIDSPLGTVKSRLARARGQMQDCLRGFGELLPAEFRFEGEKL
jgi:RNA polymerase sigma-70 factor (ECF subfamily)